MCWWEKPLVDSRDFKEEVLGIQALEV